MRLLIFFNLRIGVLYCVYATGLYKGENDDDLCHFSQIPIK